MTSRLKRTPSSPDGALPAAVVHALLASTADMITLSDRTGRLVYASPATERVSGYTVAEFLAQHPFATIHPEDQPRCQAAFAQLLATPGLQLDLEHRVRHKDGAWRWVDGSFTSLFHDPTVNGLLAILRDSTERHRADAALRASEERLRRLVNVPRVGVLTFDYAGTLLDANDAMLDLLGYDRAAFAAQAFTWRDFTPSEYVDASERVLAQLRETGHGGPYEKEYVRHDGSRIWLMFVAADLGDGTIAEVAIDISARARAEAAVHESEAKYRTLFETIDEGFGILELIYGDTNVPYDWTYVEANAALERLSGQQHVVGKLGSELIPQGDRSWLMHLDTVHTTGEPLRFEHYNEGTGRWYAAYFSKVGPDARNHIAVVLSDITERKHHEQRQDFVLRLSDTLRAEAGVEAVGQRAVHLLAEQLRVDRVYLVTLTPGDDTVVVTHEARRADLPPLSGAYRGSDFPSAIKDLFARTIVYADVRTDARLTELDRRSFAGLGAVGFMAAPIRRGTEAMIWAAGAVSTHPRAWTAAEVALFEDAVERTWAAIERARAEATIAESEAHYRRLFDTMAEGFAVCDAIRDASGTMVDYRFVQLNRALEQLTGLNPERTVGQTALAVLPGLDRWWFDTYQRVLDTHEPVRFEHYVPQLARWYDVTAFYYGPERFGTLYDDITARKAADAERERLFTAEQAARADAEAALATRDQFLSIASHELRTPLTSLIGYAFLLPRAATQGTPAITSLSARITEQARRLDTLVGQLLDVSRLQQGAFVLDRQPLDLAVLVTQVVDAFRVALPADHAHPLTLHRPDATVLVDADGPRVEQVLLNLLTNAAKYSAPDRPIMMTLATEGDQAIITVADQGIGIPHDAQARLFEPFFRAANVPAQSSGFGIGLYVVQQIVERHGGRLEIDSAEGHGTTVRVVLPLADSAWGPRRSDGRGAAADRSRGETRDP